MSPLELHPLKPMALERDASGEATRIHAAGPSFGHVSVRISFHCGHTSCAPAAARAAWDLLERGTGTLDRVRWLQAVEDLGAAIGYPLTRDTASITIDALEPHIEAACELALDALCDPPDDPEELADWIDETNEELDASRREPEVLLSLGWARAWWREPAWQRPSVGTREQRARLTVEGIAAARRQLASAPITVGVAGDDPSRWSGLVTRIVERIRLAYEARSGIMQAPPPAPEDGARRWLKGAEGAQAALLGLGRAPSPEDPGWPAVTLHAMAFGGGFASPLIARVRGDAGLSYDISWSALSGRPEGRCEARLSPAIDAIDETITLVEAVWHEQALSDDLVRLAKALLLGNHVAALETVAARMRLAVHLDTLGLPIERLWALPNAVLETSATAVREAASVYGPGRQGWTWLATSPFAGAEVLSLPPDAVSGGA